MTEREKTLYSIVEYILNQADDHDMAVILKAVQKRESSRALDMSRLAHSMGKSIEDQISVSKKDIENIVRNYICDMIRKEQPDISDRDMKVLMDEWLPSEKAKAAKLKRTDKQLPSALLLKMIDQFLRFSTGQMSASEQAELRREMPEWQNSYWKYFPSKIRGLITLYLKGKIGAEICWQEMKRELAENGKCRSSNK